MNTNGIGVTKQMERMESQDEQGAHDAQDEQDYQKMMAVRALLGHMEAAGVAESILDVDDASMEALMGKDMANCIRHMSSKWANSGTVVVIAGGGEDSRDRVMDWCLFWALCVHIKSVAGRLARKFDMTVMSPYLSTREVGGRSCLAQAEKLLDPPVIAIRELGVHSQPSPGASGQALSFAIRKRRLEGHPTIVTVSSMEEVMDQECIGRELWEAIYGHARKTIRIVLGDKAASSASGA